LFFWQILLFIVLVFLLKKYAWGPILTAINNREEGIRNALDEAEKARREMEALNADNERVLKEARVERDQILKEARELKESIISEAKDEAKEQASKVISQAKATIETEKQAAIATLKHQLAEISIEIAEKVVQDELEQKDKQIALVEKMLKKVTIN
jgi:F-type H+-transporting ATPase subunit b